MKIKPNFVSRVAPFLFAIVVFSLTPAALSVQPPEREALPHFDKRLAEGREANKIAPDKKAALDRLKKNIPAVEVDHDPILGSPKFVHSPKGFLSGPNGEGKGISNTAARGVPANDRHHAVKAFLNDHAGLFGHGAEAVNKARVKREHVDAHNGLRTIVWQQEVDGIPVFEGILKGHITKNGELVNLASQFVPDPEKAADKGTPKAVREKLPVSAKEAIAKAAAFVGDEMTSGDVSAVGPEESTPEKLQTFRGTKIKGDNHARLTWFALDSSEMRLSWEVIFTSKSRDEMYQVLVDAQTGEPLYRRGLTEHISDATYNVYTSDSPSPFSPGHSAPSAVQPPLIPRVLVTTNAVSVIASPDGWINDGDNETKGNNVLAHLDRNDDDQPDLPRPQGNPSRVFNFPVDLTQEPTTYGEAAVVNLFYWNNWIHDKLYHLGFTEAAGNFQVNNFGRGGLGNDPVLADAQDGLSLNDPFHVNNANMATPPDGFSPRMQMYTWSGPTPDRDGDFDNEVIIHEYVHGLSNRRVGGGAGISAMQSRGMGEGWSDFYALSLLSDPSDDVNGNYPIAGYAGFRLAGLTQNYYFGIRRYPYSTDLSRSPLTYKDIDPTQASDHQGIPRNPIHGPFDPNESSQFHNQGEVWCSMLWEVRANLINKYGHAVGNQLVLQLVTDGMGLSAANPTFIQARDGILQADLVNNGGANLNEIWAGFAKRGMGANASAPPSSTTTGVVESYELPGLSVTSLAISGGNNNGRVDPNECNDLTITLINQGGIPATGISARLSTTTPDVIIAQPVSTYADIPSGSTGANTTPFKISTAPTFICGTPIGLVLVIKSDQETKTNFLTLNTGQLGSPRRFDNNTVTDIPDNNPAGISSSVVVSNITTAIGKVIVSLHVNHTFDADLVMRLVAPDGTTITLSQNNGGSGDNYGIGCTDAQRTTFDDAAAGSFTTVVAPFIGSFRPHRSRGVLNGKSGSRVSGRWQFQISDVIAIDTGSLRCWSLTLVPSSCTDGGGECPGADLAIGMRANPDPVVIGSNLVYTITVTNNGPNTAKGVVVNQTLDGSLVYVSGSSSQGTVSQAGGVVTCNLGNMSARSVATISVIAIPTADGTIFSTANVVSSETDFDPSNNTVTLGTRVNKPLADLAISLADAPDPVLVGGTLTYTISVTNKGPSTANQVTVTNTLPASFAFLSATSTQGTCSNANNGNIICSVGTLANGASATITVRVRPTQNGSFTATARVSALQVDPIASNNNASAVTTVTPAADLVLRMSDFPDPVVTGSNVTYVITVTNNGPSVATNVVVVDTLPASVAFISSSASIGSVSRSNNIVTWNIGNLNFGTGGSLTLVVMPPTDGTIVNTATATSNQADPDLANNTAVEQTTVSGPFVMIEGAGVTLTAESVSPANGAVDFGERVTVDFRLKNTGNVNTTNLIVTLLATGGVSAPSSPQNYGVLAAAGVPVGRTFSFTAPSSGSNVTATLQLQDGSFVHPPVSFTFILPKTFWFTNSAPIVIPDVGAASPFPSTITVSNLPGLIGKVTASLVNLNHSYPDDLDVLLVGPAGNKVMLMSDAGGSHALVNVTPTFDDAAVSPIPDSGAIGTASYQPADYEPGNELTSVPPGLVSTSLATFNGTKPNGIWSLYIEDDTPGDMGAVSNGWRLAITTITPVNKLADLALSGTDSPDPVLMDEILTYTFVATNKGPDTATSVFFTNNLPASVSLLWATSSQGVIVSSASRVTCNLGDLLSCLPAQAY